MQEKMKKVVKKFGYIKKFYYLCNVKVKLI